MGPPDPEVVHHAIEDDSKIFRDLLLGFVKVHVLHHASQEPIYGSGIMEDLDRHGYELSAGTLYPLLHGLDAAAFLKRDNRVVDGKVRKYYEITPLGERALEEARKKILELVGRSWTATGRHRSPAPLRGPTADPPSAHGEPRQGRHERSRSTISAARAARRQVAPGNVDDQLVEAGEAVGRSDRIVDGREVDVDVDAPDGGRIPADGSASVIEQLRQLARHLQGLPEVPAAPAKAIAGSVHTLACRATTPSICGR